MPARDPQVVRPFAVDLRFVVIVIATCCVPALGYLLVPFAGPRLALLLVALAQCGLGIWLFVTDGGPAFTVHGIFHLAAAVFFGGAALLHLTVVSPSERFSTHDQLLLVATLALVVHGSVAFAGQLTMCWRLRPGEDDRAPPRSDALWTSHWPVTAGLTSILLSAAASSLWPAAGFVLDKLAYVGGLVALAGAVERTRQLRSANSRAVLAATVIFAAFFALIFERYGRLVLATFLLAMIAVLNLRRPVRWHKWIVVMAIVPGLFVGGLLRHDATDGAGGRLADVAVEGAGLGSVYRPLDALAELVAIADAPTGDLSVERQWGRTFLASALFFVPRTLWTDKPPGFGYELGRILRPTGAFRDEAAVAGYSASGLHLAEWHVNFGWPGWLIAAVFVSLAMATADRWVSTGRTGRGSTQRRIAAAIVMVGIVPFVWNNSFTATSRTVQRLVALALLTALLRMLTRSVRPER